MASILCYSAPLTIRACSGSGSLKPDSNNRKKSVSWWAPIFGLSTSEPDYLNIETASVSQESGPGKTENSGSGQKLRRGYLTEEKARELRRKIAEASNHHDAMYHSAIASRLASDTSGRVKD